ncbi:hypothetical protein DP117_09660 [Brasilonema sp. UFV-L1]|nr:hypothetical protein [Brasilonema sp. UFV-L1]
MKEKIKDKVVRNKSIVSVILRKLLEKTSRCWVMVVPHPVLRSPLVAVPPGQSPILILKSEFALIAGNMRERA